MTAVHLIKNVEFAEPFKLADLVEYQAGQVVSRTMAQPPHLSLTLFAFDQGEGISSHSASGDALVQVLDGEALITIGDKKVTVAAGEAVVMPAGTPHALDAPVRFKMLLTVVKPAIQ
ncbi:MAG: cupin domain-containing protein [Pseudomonadota bacterium]